MNEFNCNEIHRITLHATTHKKATKRQYFDTYNFDDKIGYYQFGWYLFLLAFNGKFSRVSVFM